LEREAKALELETFGDSETERLERFKHAIRVLAQLFDRGTRISPSLQAPPEVKKIFPDVDKIGLLSSTIKELEDRPDNDGASDNSNGDAPASS
jgi:hypothetical protein